MSEHPVSATTADAVGVLDGCAARHWTLATAESLTGGLVAAMLIEVPGASAVVRGAIVAYATDLKATLLGVDGDLLAERGAVDGEVALAMAAGVRRMLRTDVGLATTGVAGPNAADGHEPGVVFVAAVTPTASHVSERRFAGGRGAIRWASATAVLELARSMLVEP